MGSNTCKNGLEKDEEVGPISIDVSVAWNIQKIIFSLLKIYLITSIFFFSDNCMLLIYIYIFHHARFINKTVPSVFIVVIKEEKAWGTNLTRE